MLSAYVLTSGVQENTLELKMRPIVHGKNKFIKNYWTCSKVSDPSSSSTCFEELLVFFSISYTVPEIIRKHKKMALQKSLYLAEYYLFFSQVHVILYCFWCGKIFKEVTYNFELFERYMAEKLSLSIELPVWWFTST